MTSLPNCTRSLLVLTIQQEGSRHFYTKLFRTQTHTTKRIIELIDNDTIPLAMKRITRSLLANVASWHTIHTTSSGIATIRKDFASVVPPVTSRVMSTDILGGRAKAFIYSGPGASQKGVNAIMKLLQPYVEESTRFTAIKTIDSEDIPNASNHNDEDLLSEWMGGGAVLIMPGGKTYTRFLSPIQIKTIRDFVHRGGSYLGLCAGAYFGATRCFFGGDEVATPQQRLRLFSGDAIGSITPQPYDPLSERGAAAVEVILSPTFVNRCESAGEITPNQKPLQIAFSSTSLPVYAN